MNKIASEFVTMSAQYRLIKPFRQFITKDREPHRTNMQTRLKDMHIGIHID